MNPLAIYSSLLVMFYNCLFVGRIQNAIHFVLFLVVENVVMSYTELVLRSTLQTASTALV